MDIHLLSFVWTAEIKEEFQRKEAFFWFGGTLGSASRAEFPVSLSNHVGFTPRLLYSRTHHSPESLPIWKLVELKMLDLSDQMRTSISILTSAADRKELEAFFTKFVPPW